MTAPTPESAKIQSLEGLRGVMAWWVVLGHVSLAFGWSLPLIDRNGLAVDVFILLSGFVIARLINQKKENYGPYIIRRGFRLFPLYLAVLTVSAVALPIQLSAWSYLPYDTWSNANRILLAEAAMKDIVAHLSIHIPLAQGLVPEQVLPNAAYTIVGQAWSISLEWQFYLIAPLLMWTLGSWRRLPVLVVATAALLGLSLFLPGAFLGAKILHFIVGIFTYVSLNATAYRWRWTAATVAAAVATIVVDGPAQVIPMAIWLVVILATLKFPRNPIRWVEKVLSSRPAVHLGEISYSVYLVHMIPLWGSIWLLERVGVQGPALEVSVLMATVLFAYLLARVSYVTIEKPGIRMGARISQARAPLAAPEMSPGA